MKKIKAVPYMEFYTTACDGINFTVELVKNWETFSGKREEVYDSWLCRERCGVKHYMFGVLASNTTWKEYIKMVESNLPEYIAIYQEEVQ